MENYEYVARDRAGNRRVGLHRAETSQDALSWLRDNGLFPVSVKPVATKHTKVAKGRGKRVKSEEMAGLCWQLTTMIEGGIAITDAIDTVVDDIENATLRETLVDVSARMKTGETFSDSLSQHPKVFNTLFYAMILAGEAGGTLPNVLRRLATHFDNRDRMIGKLRAALSYPIFVLGFIVVMIVVMMLLIIPRFTSMFDQIHGELPAFTLAFMNFYDMLMANSPYMLGGVAVIVIGLIAYHKTPKGHEVLSKVLLGTPLIGTLVSQAFVAMFCRTMSTLLSAGVSVIETLDILSRMTRNDVIKGAILSTREHIMSGSNISLSMTASKFFPGMVSKMTRVGEESGSLPAVLDRTSDYYEKKVDVTITTLTGFLQPVLIVGVGGIVLTVVIALYLPIFSIG